MNKFSELELETGNNKEHKVKTIQESIVYTKKIKEQLSKLYYLLL